MKAFTIAGVNLRRFFRDRSNVFWVFIFPILLILVLGAAFGGSSDPRLGVYHSGEGELAAELVVLLEEQPGMQVIGFESRDALLATVERAELEAGLLIPDDFDSALNTGTMTAVEFLARNAEDAQAIRSSVQSALTQQSVVLRAAGFVEAEGVGTFAEGLEMAGQARANVMDVTVAQSSAGEPIGFFQLGRFDASAQQQMLLFVFLTSLDRFGCAYPDSAVGSGKKNGFDAHPGANDPGRRRLGSICHRFDAGSLHHGWHPGLLQC